MSERTPYDGTPYYCADCGCGFGEFLACELPGCRLESLRAARERRREFVRVAKKRQLAAAGDREPPPEAKG